MIVTIVFGDRAIQKELCDLDFDTALELAEGYGYTEGVIIMICESETHGEVYKYRKNTWQQVGTTCGYA